MHLPAEEVIAASRQGLARLSVEQFHHMIEAGILDEGDAVELIAGILVRRDSSDAGGESMTHGPKHAYYLQRVLAWVAAVAASGHHPRQQLPLTLVDSEPEPDVALVRGSVDDYRERHPVASECALVIEVADSSLEYDRTVKASIYAAAAIATYWIVNVREGCVEVHEAPLADEKRYARVTSRRPGQHATLELPSGVAATLPIDALFASRA